MRTVQRLSPLLAVVLLVAAVGAAPATSRPPSQAGGPCANMGSGVQCAAGNNRQTVGGGEKVPHNGWPRISGVLAKALDSADHTLVGGPDNDELLAHHGSDTVSGGAGHDVIWGDWDPRGNTTRQRDILRGGAGNDWIYPSHGTTRVDAGPGRDYVWAFFGNGTIDCGAGGNDTARVRETGAFKVRNCEHVLHFCQFGSNSDGSCKKPGETLTLARRPRGARS